MADIDLARKYRSKNLEEYVGNKLVKRTVSILRQKEHKPQVMMLFGSSGCGKTTMARLLAMEYMCENPTDTGACGVCYSCQEMLHFIETGEEVLDVHEIDLTDDNTKAKMDNILVEALQPTMEKYKIYILDECHMASEGAQNRMLKIVEEPPEHLVFIFCTTEPKKMLPTLLNRCVYKLKVKKPSVKEIADRLKFVCKEEEIDYTMSALRTIVKIAKMVPRDSLNNLQNVMEVYGNVDDTAVANQFGVIEYQYYFDFLESVAKKREDKFLNLIVKIMENDIDMDNFVNELQEFITRGVFITYGKRLDEFTQDELKAYKELFSKFTIEELLYISDILVSIKLNRDALEDDYTLCVYLMNKLIYNKTVKKESSESSTKPLVEEIRKSDTVEKTEEEFVKTAEYNKRQFDAEKNVKDEPISLETIAEIFQTE